MKITILNGTHQPAAIDDYLAELESLLRARGHEITHLQLRNLPLRYCIGCWGCWVKTPGQCLSRDASIQIDRAVINSDFTLWAAPLKMGFPGFLLKMALDKHLPLIHPYMEVVHNEAHHLKRYKRYPRLGLLVEKEPDTDQVDLRIVTDILSRTALNFKSRLEFSLTTEVAVADAADHITSANPKRLPLPMRFAAIPGKRVSPPKRLTLFNGSPRGRKGNTPIFLREIAAGFSGPSEIYQLNRIHETEQLVRAFANAECAIIGFPLYTDAMPGVVKHFIEALGPLAGKTGNPPVGFVVQSGFPESLHSRYLERYLEKLAARLGSQYLGTIVKGNGEGTRVMPDSLNESLFAQLRAVGSGLAEEGCFDVEILSKIAQPEYYSPILSPFFQVFLRLPIAHSYFDNMLKANGVFDQRFARPFIE